MKMNKGNIYLINYDCIRKQKHYQHTGVLILLKKMLYFDKNSDLINQTV